MDRLVELIVRVIVWFSKYTAFFARFGLGHYDVWQQGEKLKLLLVGYNGARNTGADARVIAMVEQIEDAFGQDNVQISVMTLDKNSTQGYFPERIQMIPFSTIFFFELYRQCSRHHAVILCEGSTLKSTFANALTMFFCQAAGIAKNQNKPCIAYGSEVGTMEPFLEKLARDLCSDAYFIVRTEESYRRLQALGLRGHVGTDTAWTFRAGEAQQRMQQTLRESGWDGKKPILGVAVINPFWWPVRSSVLKWMKCKLTGNKSLQFNNWYFFSDSKQRRAQYHTYIAQIAEAVNRFRAEQDYYVAVIGMERLDAEACTKLSGMLEHSHSILLSRDYTVFELTGVLRSLSALITSRYHASVLSMEQKIPIIAISMDERLDSIMKEVKLHHDYLHHVDDFGLADGIYQSLMMAKERRAELSEGFDAALDYYHQTLQQMSVFLKQFLYEQLRINQTEER